MVLETLTIGGQRDVEGKKNDYHEREIPSYKSADQRYLVLLTEVGVAMEKDEHYDKDAQNLDYEWSSRHFDAQISK